MACLAVGDGVEIQGLQKRPELNGRRGRLLGHTHEDRWAVRLNEDAAANLNVGLETRAPDLKVREANLAKVQDCDAWKMEVNAAGVSAHKEGRYEDAARSFGEYLDLCPGSCKVMHNNRAGSLLRLGRYVEAIQDADACMRADPIWERGWLRKVEALRAGGRVTEALDVALDGTKSLPNSCTRLQAQRDELFALPENEGFLAGCSAESIKRRGKIFCAVCLAVSENQDRDTTSGAQYLYCQSDASASCGLVRYCSERCRSADRPQHGKSCADLRRAHAIRRLFASGRIWAGVAQEGAPQYLVKVDGVLAFCFPRQVGDLSGNASRITSWRSWAELSVAKKTKGALVEEVLAAQFQRIVCGSPGSFPKPEDELLHGLATDVATYPLTLWRALQKFGLGDGGKKESLVIHVVGAEMSKEGPAHAHIGPMLRSLLGPRPHLLVVSIGPLYLSGGDTASELEIMQQWRKRSRSGCRFTMHQPQRMDYAEYLASPFYEKPDLVMFFHPGFHDGTYPWWPTLQFLLHEDVPLALTSFSEDDFLQNQDMTQSELFQTNIEFGRTPEEAVNPFESAIHDPVVTGENLLYYPNRYLTGWRGIQKRFPKGGGAYDAGHAELMAITTCQSAAGEASSRVKSVLQARGRSYVEFAKALGKTRPPKEGMMCDWMPQMWDMTLRGLGVCG